MVDRAANKAEEALELDKVSNNMRVRRTAVPCEALRMQSPLIRVLYSDGRRRSLSTVYETGANDGQAGPGNGDV